MILEAEEMATSLEKERQDRSVDSTLRMSSCAFDAADVREVERMARGDAPAKPKRKPGTSGSSPVDADLEAVQTHRPPPVD